MEQQSNTHFWAGNGTHGVGSIKHEVTVTGERYHGGSRAEVHLHSMEGNQQERENERERERELHERGHVHRIFGKRAAAEKDPMAAPHPHCGLHSMKGNR